MCIPSISEAFKTFEEKYHLPPIFQISDGKLIGAFIMTKGGESFMISFDSSDDDIVAAARFLSPDSIEEAKKDLLFLKSLCSFPAFRYAAPATLQ